MASNKLLFSKNLKELRIHLCQTSKSSAGVRDFVEKHYPQLKAANPQFPILIRECSGILPKVFARYEYGKELSAPLSNEGMEEVWKRVVNLATQKSP